MGAVVDRRCIFSRHLLRYPLDSVGSLKTTFMVKDATDDVRHSTSRHETRLEIMTAAWLLPIVSNVVAAASGGVVAEVLTNPQHALWTVITSYILWGTGVPLAVVVMVVYFQRLAFHKLPPKQVIVSVFLPLGPLGQGSFGYERLNPIADRLDKC